MEWCGDKDDSHYLVHVFPGKNYFYFLHRVAKDNSCLRLGYGFPDGKFGVTTCDVGKLTYKLEVGPLSDNMHYYMLQNPDVVCIEPISENSNLVVRYNFNGEF